jgi:hypothetical protein
MDGAGNYTWFNDVTATGSNTYRIRHTTGGTAVSIEADGTVGISKLNSGTTNVSGVLGVSNAINYNGNSNFYVRSRKYGGIMALGTQTLESSPTTGDLYYPIVMHGTAEVTQFNTPTGEAMRIESDGAVLIGTTVDGSAGAGDVVVNGGVYLGGSAAANKLDDYEEGTWANSLSSGETNDPNPTYSQASKYTKVGNLVTLHTEVAFITSGTGSYYFPVAALPFVRDGSYITGTVSVLDGGTAWYTGVARADGSKIIFYVNDHQAFSSTVPFAVASGSHTDRLNVTITYRTTA